MKFSFSKITDYSFRKINRDKFLLISAFLFGCNVARFELLHSCFLWNVPNL